MRKRVIGAVAAAIVIGGTATGSCAVAASGNALGTRHATPAASRIRYLGAVERGVPNSYSLVSEFGRTVGRQPNIVSYYSGWKEKFKTAFARTALRHHAELLVNIDPTKIKLAQIVSGRYDPFLRRFASEVKSFNHPVIISFAHEPDGIWYSWGYKHTPARTWIAAWRHVVTVFRKEGAKKVTWLWVVNRIGTQEGPIKDWWPGSKYVTWTGIDGYLETRTASFKVTILPTIKAIRKLTKQPILLSETSVGQLAGAAAKIPGLFAGIRSQHLLGLVWFDTNQKSGVHHQRWRLEGNPAAIRAFRRGLGT